MITIQAQNLLTQNPSFEEYSNTLPTGWTADEALIEIVMDATDGSIGLKMQKDPNYSGLGFRIATSQFINLAEQPLSLRFDYKVISGQIRDIGFIMFPDTWEFAAYTNIDDDGEWHINNYADMETDYIGTGWAVDYLNIQIFHEAGFESSEVIIDNLAFGYVSTLSIEENAPLINQVITIGPNPTKSSISFFNIDKITNKNVKIFDLSGKLVHQTKLVTDQLDLSILDKGVYMLHLGDTVIKKVVKK